MHGSFSRADTNNVMAAIGPDFKKGFVDEAPVSNADVGKTIVHLLGLKPRDKGRLVGRVMKEAFIGGVTPKFAVLTKRSAPGANGLRTVLMYQTVGKTMYFDAAGFPGPDGWAGRFESRRKALTEGQNSNAAAERTTHGLSRADFWNHPLLTVVRRTTISSLE